MSGFRTDSPARYGKYVGENTRLRGSARAFGVTVCCSEIWPLGRQKNDFKKYVLEPSDIALTCLATLRRMIDLRNQK